MEACTEQFCFRCLAPLPVNCWLANVQHFLQFNKTLGANIVSRSTVLQNALANSEDDAEPTLVLPTGAGHDFFDAWAVLASSEAQYKAIAAFSVSELLAGLKTSDFFADEDSVAILIHGLVDRMFPHDHEHPPIPTHAGDSIVGKEYHLRSRVVPAPRKRQRTLSRSISSSSCRFCEARKTENGKILQQLPYELAYRLLTLHAPRVVRFIKCLPSTFHHLVVEATMYNQPSGYIGMPPHYEQQPCAFTQEHKAGVLTAAGRLAATHKPRGLVIDGWWIAPGEPVVFDALDMFLGCVPWLSDLHLVAVQPDSAPTLTRLLPQLTALSKFVIFNEGCVSIEGLNDIVRACSTLPELRIVCLPRFIEHSDGAESFCDALGTLTQIEGLDLRGCFRNVEEMQSYPLAAQKHASYPLVPHALAGALQKLTRLKTLGLADTLEGQSADCVFQAVSQLHLTGLSLSCMDFCAQRSVVDVFAGIIGRLVIHRNPCASATPMLQQLVHLQALDMCGFHIQADACEQAAASIACMTSLTELNLSEVEVSEGFWHTFAARATTLTNMVKLSCKSVDSITPKNARELSAVFSCMTGLHELELNSSNLGSAAADVAGSLSNLSALSTLGLARCSIDHRNDGLIAVKELLGKLFHLPRLEILMICHNNFGVDGAAALSAALPGMPNLQLLLLKPSDIGGEPGRLLLEAAAVRVYGVKRGYALLSDGPNKAESEWFSTPTQLKVGGVENKAR